MTTHTRAEIIVRWRNLARRHGIHPDFADGLMAIVKIADNKFKRDLGEACEAICASADAYQGKGINWWFARNVWAVHLGHERECDSLQKWIKEALDFLGRGEIREAA